MSLSSRVACIQMNSSDDIAKNLFVAKEFIKQAADQGAQLVILPENFAIMGLQPDDKLKYREAIGSGPIQDFLSLQAAEHGVWIVGGTIPLKVPDDESKVYASCLVFDDMGQRVGRYDKIHLFDVNLSAVQESYSESSTIVAGDKIVVIDTPFGKLGLAICYDLRFPEMFRLMLQHNVELIAIPAAFTYTTGSVHWETLVKARAIENLAYVLTACQTGIHANKRKTFGNSMVVNPWGEVLVCLPDNPGVIMAEINLDFLRKLRQDFPALAHRKF